MKRKPQASRREHFEHVLLFREEIEGIISTLESRGMKVTLEDRAFEFDSLEEVEQRLGKRPRRLTIVGCLETDENEWIKLEMDNGITWLSYTGCAVAQATGRELSGLVAMCSAKLSRVMSPTIWGLISLVTGLSGIALAYLGLGNDPVKSPLWARVALMFPLIPFATSIAYRQTFTSARLDYHHQGGFWTKNKDSILLVAVGAVLGGFFTFLATIFAK